MRGQEDTVFTPFGPAGQRSIGRNERTGSLYLVRPRNPVVWQPGPLPALLGRLAAVLGVAASGFYAVSGLALAHYDAKAHLVVARRILDSLTPGWEQIGAVWLPLPHLIQMLPVQLDFFYRTGALAIVVSVLSHVVTTAALAATVLALTASRSGAILAAAIYALNPNTLYLQSTPMTEPLLFALSSLQVHLMVRWILAGRLVADRWIGWVTVLACLTRYEAWPITAWAFVASAWAWWRRGVALPRVLDVHARMTLYPVGTALAFMLFSRITVGEWFVSSGFFVPDESLRGQPMAVAEKIAEGVALVGGDWLLWVGGVCASVTAVLALFSAGRTPMLVALALLGAIALPASAYLAGHPFRLRYEIPLVLGLALGAGLGLGLLRRAGSVLAVMTLALVLHERPPFDTAAPMVREAQLDQHVRGRAAVTACLQRRWDHTPIMMSMGALGHYMHELAADGFAIRDFVHEGNGALWDSAFTRGPAHLVRWVIVEEAAEGGDAIIDRARKLPRLLEDFDRRCSGGNIALYERKAGHIP